jgi:mono/diheme cytochrome c family protein
MATAIDLAISSERPASVIVLALDPTNPESSGQGDSRSATGAVAANEGVALQLAVTRDNQERLLQSAQAGLDALLQSQEQHKWEINLDGVAAIAFGGDVESASRAVGLFNGYCARCHTSGWSAGVPFTQEAGSGGFGPALWEGRPNIQFLTPEALIEFITDGSVAQAPYGVNGIGSGRMPAFGQILTTEDLELIATYLRSGNLTGAEWAMREFFRELLSANLFVTGILLTLAAFAIFYGTISLLLVMNTGRRLGLLLTGAGIFGWLTITSMLFVVYAPRGPRPADIEGLNAFEIRIIPMTYLVVSAAIFIGFLVALKQYEDLQESAS